MRILRFLSFSCLVLILGGCKAEVQLPSVNPGPSDPAHTSPPSIESAVDEAVPSDQEWPTVEAGQRCEVLWLSPQPGPRNGQLIDAEVEVPIAEGTELTDLQGWSYPQDQGTPDGLPAEVMDHPQPGRFALRFQVPTDGRWSLCASCIQSDGQVGDACSEGWTIDNVPPAPPANFRRID